MRLMDGLAYLIIVEDCMQGISSYWWNHGGISDGSQLLATSPATPITVYHVGCEYGNMSKHLDNASQSQVPGAHVSELRDSRGCYARSALR